MIVQGMITAGAIAERTVDLTMTVLAATVVGLLVAEALYLAVCVLYLSCRRGDGGGQRRNRNEGTAVPR